MDSTTFSRNCNIDAEVYPDATGNRQNAARLYRAEQADRLMSQDIGRAWSLDIAGLRSIAADARRIQQQGSGEGGESPINLQQIDYAIAEAERKFYGINEKLTQEIMAKVDTAKWFKVDEDTRDEIDQNLRAVVSGIGLEPSSWSDTYRTQFQERQAIFRQLEPLVQEYVSLEKGTEASAALMNQIHQLERELSNAFDRHLAPPPAKPRVFKGRISY